MSAAILSAGPEMARMVSHALLKTDTYGKPIVAAVNGGLHRRWRRAAAGHGHPRPRCRRRASA